MERQEAREVSNLAFHPERFACLCISCLRIAVPNRVARMHHNQSQPCPALHQSLFGGGLPALPENRQAARSVGAGSLYAMSREPLKIGDLPETGISMRQLPGKSRITRDPKIRMPLPVAARSPAENLA